MTLNDYYYCRPCVPLENETIKSRHLLSLSIDIKSTEPSNRIKAPEMSLTLPKIWSIDRCRYVKWLKWFNYYIKRKSVRCIRARSVFEPKNVRSTRLRRISVSAQKTSKSVGMMEILVGGRTYLVVKTWSSTCDCYFRLLIRRYYCREYDSDSKSCKFFFFLLCTRLYVSLSQNVR